MSNARLEAATQKQRAAADPAVSAWVRANAGTGKTHVLVQRILRLLLTGAEARSILCLTYTKNAAAEMEARVLDELGRWATATDGDLQRQLTTSLGRAPHDAETILARRLFAAVIDAPGGLAMMTIHGFCERVLRRFSLEAGVPPGFAVMTEEEAREALALATAAGLQAKPDGFETLVNYADENGFASVLRDMLGKRAKLTALFRCPDDDPISNYEKKLRDLFQLEAHATTEKLRDTASELLDRHLLQTVIAALSQGKPSDLEAEKRLRQVAAASNVSDKFAASKAALFTKEGKARSSLATKDVRTAASTVFERLCDLQVTFADLDAKICALKAMEATSALLRLTEVIFEEYAAEKQKRGALDFDDLIEKTLSLLSRANAAEWVLYQLDQRIDHVLIDEAQDTAPAQWAILERLTGDFFAGQGAREVTPTIFCVGDEKQSIYGFQGAEPELLTANGEAYGHRVRAANFDWRSVNLDLSFRTLSPILNAVDLIASSIPGLNAGAYVPHLANRNDAGGYLEIWEPETAAKPSPGDVYEIDDTVANPPKPTEVLADRIAAQIAHWLTTGEALASSGRAIQPGDVLILLRKREPMATLLQSALKRAGVPVAGSDRMAILDTLAVADMLTLADAFLQPHDDLALATVLKSPLFGIAENELYCLAYDRQSSLWDVIHEQNQDIAAKLQRWRSLALAATPVNFFAEILEGDGARDAFAARLGAQCHDALDELLTQAEGFEARGGSYLSDFVTYLRRSGSEVKREAAEAAHEVRIMTVHGAKGLEAPIVILADTCRVLGADNTTVHLLEPDGLPIWAVKGTANLAQIEAAKTERRSAQVREDGRLFYVAMTRARDRLYIAGAHGRADVPKACWHETVRHALEPHLVQSVAFDGRKAWLFGDHTRFAAVINPEASKARMELPAFYAARPATERRINILSPSQLAAWDGGNDVRGNSTAGRRTDSRALGNLIHRLLELLPTVPAKYRLKLANMIATAHEFGLPRAEREGAIATALATVAELNHADLIKGDRLFECDVGLKFMRDGIPEVILGRADLITISADDVSVFDYKSGDYAPADVGGVNAYAAQLSAYALALQRIFPSSHVEAAVLHTRTNTISRADRDFEGCLMATLRKYHTSNLDA